MPRLSDRLPDHLPDRQQAATALLLLFAFSAWNLTGPAHIALFGLLLLFLADLRRAGPRLTRDPALWLGVAALVLSTLLAVRAAFLLPETAPRQWSGIWEWSSPFLFVVFAWWLRADLRRIRLVLLAALLGIVVGVLRKSDWSLLADVLAGQRYHFGQPALGIAFIASVALLGVALFRQRLRWLAPATSKQGEAEPVDRLQADGNVHRSWRERPHPLLGTALWLLAILFLVGMLIVLQARGAVLGLMVAGLVLAAYRLWGMGRQAGADARADARAAARRRRGAVLLSLVLVTILAGVVTWSGRDRLAVDIAALGPNGDAGALGWTSSMAIRVNLWRAGLDLFAARPWLGWGPGTDPTKVLIPVEVVPLPAATLRNAPDYSHLHSVIIEALVRFGLSALLIALPLVWLLFWSGRTMWRVLADQDPRLREFLVLVALMTLLFLVYEYRLVHVDMRFFVLLFLGIWYSFHLHRALPDRVYAR